MKLTQKIITEFKMLPLGIHRRVLALEITGNTINLVGLYSSGPNVSHWLDDSFEIEEGQYSSGLREVLKKYPEIQHIPVAVALPGLKVLFRASGNGSGPDGKYGDLLPGMSRSDVIAVSQENSQGNGHQPLWACVKAVELEPWLELFDDAGLNVAAVFKGTCEWVNTCLVLSCGGFEYSKYVALQTPNVTVIEIRDGVFISARSHQIQGDRALENFAGSLINGNGQTGFNWIFERDGKPRENSKVLDILKQKMDTGLCGNSSPWLDPGQIVAAGCGLLVLNPQLAGFNLLPKDRKENFSLWQKFTRWRRIGLGVFAGWFFITALLVIISLVSGHRAAKWQERRAGKKSRITRIQELKKQRQDLVMQMETLKELYARRSNMAQVMVLMAGSLPKRTVLSSVSYSTTNGKSQLLIKGISRDDSGVLDLFTRLLDLKVFENVELLTIEQIPQRSRGSTAPPNSKNFSIRIIP